MCWNREDEYCPCFDYMYIGTDEDGISDFGRISLVHFLKEWDIQVVDNSEECWDLTRELWELLTKWHDEGRIRPMTDAESKNWKKAIEKYDHKRLEYYNIIDKMIDKEKSV